MGVPGGWRWAVLGLCWLAGWSGWWLASGRGSSVLVGAPIGPWPFWPSAGPWVASGSCRLSPSAPVVVCASGRPPLPCWPACLGSALFLLGALPLGVGFRSLGPLVRSRPLWWLWGTLQRCRFSCAVPAAVCPDFSYRRPIANFLRLPAFAGLTDFLGHAALPLYSFPPLS